MKGLLSSQPLRKRETASYAFLLAAALITFRRSLLFFIFERFSLVKIQIQCFLCQHRVFFPLHILLYVNPLGRIPLMK